MSSSSSLPQAAIARLAAPASATRRHVAFTRIIQFSLPIGPVRPWDPDGVPAGRWSETNPLLAQQHHGNPGRTRVVVAS